MYLPFVSFVKPKRGLLTENKLWTRKETRTPTRQTPTHGDG